MVDLRKKALDLRKGIKKRGRRLVEDIKQFEEEAPARRARKIQTLKQDIEISRLQGKLRLSKAIGKPKRASSASDIFGGVSILGGGLGTPKPTRPGKRSKKGKKSKKESMESVGGNDDNFFSF